MKGDGLYCIGFSPYSLPLLYLLSREREREKRLCVLLICVRVHGIVRASRRRNSRSSRREKQSYLIQFNTKVKVERERGEREENS